MVRPERDSIGRRKLFGAGAGARAGFYFIGMIIICSTMYYHSLYSYASMSDIRLREELLTGEGTAIEKTDANVAATSISMKRISNANFPKTSGHVCKEGERPKDDKGFNYHSQNKEDWELLEQYHLGQLCNGTYLEMGGLDGLQYSNSFAFHDALGWKGVLIEASPTNYAKLVQNRPNEIANINAGICAEEKDLHWVNNDRIGAVSGFLEFAAPSFRKKWWNKEQVQNAKVIRCRTLKNVLLDAVGEHYFFDFFSLDIEGGELDAIMSLDFDLVSFGVIFVEADGHNQLKNLAVQLYLEKNGYKFVKSQRNSDWFVNIHFADIYKDIITRQS